MTTFGELKSRIISYINKYELISAKDKVLIAISGGMDSMFLLHSFIELKNELNIEIAIGHINHNIRDNSISDEKFALDQAHELGIPIHIKKLDFSSKMDCSLSYMSACLTIRKTPYVATCSGCISGAASLSGKIGLWPA